MLLLPSAGGVFIVLFGLTLFRDGAKRIRTADPFNAIEVLYQLSYSPASAEIYHLLRGGLLSTIISH